MTGGRRPTDQVRERRYHLQTRYPIFEVLPKRESVFATRFLETGEGVATVSSRLTAHSNISYLKLTAMDIMTC
jgi:hypothetical protein